MELKSIPEKIRSSVFFSIYQRNRSFIILTFFLIAVILLAFIFPFLSFGRFFGTDDYTHLFHTNLMASSERISEFYEKSAAIVDDPSSEANAVNYPFGLWLFGATLAKISGSPPITADYIFVIFFLLIIIATYYVYSGIWLKSREQKLCSVLFLISIPSMALGILEYRPSIFILPFLFILLIFAFKEPADWKLFPVAVLSIFIIVISHTGTVLFLLSFSVTFFFLYCLLWGEFSKRLYAIILTTLFTLFAALVWFPQIANQYEVKFRLFLVPGDFLATRFNFPLLMDLTHVIYDNLLIRQQLFFAVILAVIIFALGYFFMYIHRKTTTFLSKRNIFYAFTLPIQNLSHSAIATPFWMGPVQVLFSIAGVFHLNNKGKCLLISTLIITLLPDLLSSTGSTGALREISYLVIIIPITATLGFWHVLAYVHNLETPLKPYISPALWIVVCLAIIVPPVLGTTYYLPTISGEDYVIGGLKWLGGNGDHNEKIVGYTLRPIPIYTNMTDASYDIESGPENSQFISSLKNVYSGTGENINTVNDFRQSYNVRYILSSDKLLRTLKETRENLTIDSNPALNKIYASNDFGIYEIAVTSSDDALKDASMGENITIKRIGASYEITSDYYTIMISEFNPIIKRFGAPGQNLLGFGNIREEVFISRTDLNAEQERFSLGDMEFTCEIRDNQITYRTVLLNPENQNPEGTFRVRYTFYPQVIKREYILSNDWLVSLYPSQMNVQYSIRIYSPMSQIAINSDKSRLERYIYPYDDTIIKNLNINDLFLNRSKNSGLSLTFSPQSPQPTSVWWGGSGYNRSTVGIIQSATIKPGASFSSTQFFSPGSENDAKKKTSSIGGIELINYPDGITPIIISGYRTPQSEIITDEKIINGYAILADNAIPYTEAIMPMDGAFSQMDIPGRTITPIGYLKTGETGFYDYATQDTNIAILEDYLRARGASASGFVADSLNYNLDTLSILSRERVQYMFSGQVSPFLNNEYAKGYRTPQIAYVNGEPTGLVLFPVSGPLSTSLSSTSRFEEVFSNWRAIIDGASDNNEMVAFLFRSQEIGDPMYADNFIWLFAYAEEKGLTFSSPDRIAEHFRQLQNIRYSGSIDGDSASIQVINQDRIPIKNVTFKVTLPLLKNGNYRVINGDIIRMKSDNDLVDVFIRTEIPGYSTKKIRIEPDIQRKPLQVVIPGQPLIEGSSEFMVKDELGNPFGGVDVIVDSTYYRTDENGAVHVDLDLGLHTIVVQSPGYETYRVSVDVKGRIFMIGQAIGSIFES